MDNRIMAQNATEPKPIWSNNYKQNANELMKILSDISNITDIEMLHKNKIEATSDELHDINTYKNKAA